MRINIREAIRVAKHNKRKKKYVDMRQKMLTAHIQKWGDPQTWTTEQVKMLEVKRAKLYEKIMGEKYERK